jgi:hypothetical protein
MNIMNAPQFLITSILSVAENAEELRKKLYEQGVLCKDYEDDGLMLLYHKYEMPITNEFERECRSMVIDRTTFKIVSYSCETPRLNKEGLDYLLAHSSEPQIINPCYEGTYLSVFNHNGKWYVSTRRCLDSQESVFNPVQKQSPMSHYEMFDEILKKSGYEDFNDFSKKLDTTKSYYFVLIHHQNKHVIDYTTTFGENYGRICLTTVRDNEMRELDIYEDKLDFVSYDETGNIFVPTKMESFESFANLNKSVNYTEVPTFEGVVIRVWDGTMNKNHLIKLQSMNYQFSQVLGMDKNLFKGLIYLYQNDKLAEYFKQNTNAQQLKKIVNPLNTSESYDAVGMVDAVFKVCTMELFELFKVMWSLKTGKPENKTLYELLPKEYRDMMYGVRGLYYKKKAILMGKDKESVTSEDIKNSHLKISDIYNHLKAQTTDTLVAFLRMRKLMMNWTRQDTTNVDLKEFANVSKLCDKVHLKLCAIFTNKLFPTIMPNEIPPLKE